MKCTTLFEWPAPKSQGPDQTPKNVARLGVSHLHRRLCVPKTLSVLIGAKNHLTSAHNDRAAVFCGFEMAEIDLILEEARVAKGTASGPDTDSRQKLTLNRF